MRVVGNSRAASCSHTRSRNGVPYITRMMSNDVVCGFYLNTCVMIPSNELCSFPMVPQHISTWPPVLADIAKRFKSWPFDSTGICTVTISQTPWFQNTTIYDTQFHNTYICDRNSAPDFATGRKTHTKSWANRPTTWTTARKTTLIRGDCCLCLDST